MKGASTVFNPHNALKKALQREGLEMENFVSDYFDGALNI